MVFNRIKCLAAAGDIRISVHGYDRMVAHDISASELLDSIESGELLEDYPQYHAGPAILVLQRDVKGNPIHAVWGIERGTQSPAVLVTGYRPDPNRWSNDFRTRQS